jgi:hypothetical protein
MAQCGAPRFRVAVDEVKNARMEQKFPMLNSTIKSSHFGAADRIGNPGDRRGSGGIT